MTKDELLEMIREELQSLMNEDEYDRKRDAELDRNPTRGSNRHQWVYKGKPVKNPAKTFRQLYIRTMVKSKIKYKDADGKEHEATVGSLLKYPKDHPGYKAAAKLYAGGLKRAPKDEGIADLDERTVARREPPRKMSKDQVTKRDGIGKKLLKNKRSVRYFKDKFGDDWKSYLWAASTNKAIDSKKKGK